jgi:hypothetical protein
MPASIEADHEHGLPDHEYDLAVEAHKEYDAPTPAEPFDEKEFMDYVIKLVI